MFTMTIPAFGRRLFPVLACALLLSCGGDKTAGGGTDSPVAAYTYKGVVTRTQVKVCVDRNRDWVCNGGEPSTTSLADGSYSLYLVQDDDRVHPVIAEVPARWSGGIYTPAHVLAAPAGKGKFIGPLSTMVQVAVDSGMAPDLFAAEQLVAAQANRTKLYLPLSEAEGASSPRPSPRWPSRSSQRHCFTRTTSGPPPSPCSGSRSLPTPITDCP